MSKKSTKKWIIGTLITAPLLFLAAPISVGLALTHPKGRKTIGSPKDHELFFESITFTSKYDGLTLSGWWIPAEIPTDKSVIMVHGYKGERSMHSINGLSLAKSLHNQGYNVFMFDFRNSGESQGRRTGIGFYEQHDLESAIDYLVEQKHQQSVALLGWSMGASTSLITGSKHPSVRAIIADSPFSELETYLKNNLSVWSKLPDKPFTSIIMLSVQGLLRIHPKEVSPLRAVQTNNDKAYLLIHSEQDEKIPHQESVNLYEHIHSSKKELWLTKKALHVRSYKLMKKEYEQKIFEFLGKNL